MKEHFLSYLVIFVFVVNLLLFKVVIAFMRLSWSSRIIEKWRVQSCITDCNLYAQFLFCFQHLDPVYPLQIAFLCPLNQPVHKSLPVVIYTIIYNEKYFQSNNFLCSPCPYLEGTKDALWNKLRRLTIGQNYSAVCTHEGGHTHSCLSRMRM
jgi:hypothetical protein